MAGESFVGRKPQGANPKPSRVGEWDVWFEEGAKILYCTEWGKGGGREWLKRIEIYVFDESLER